MNTIILLPKNANQGVLGSMVMNMLDIHIKKKRIVDGLVLS